MQIQGITAAHYEATTLAVGSFDGVHLGHQALLRKMAAQAHAAGLPALALTFFPHPTAVLKGWSSPSYLMTPDRRARYLREAGADVVIIQTFDLAFSRMPASCFLDLVFEHLHPTQIWMGDDFTFGHNREGNRAYLEEAQLSYGFDLNVVPPIVIDEDVVSSTRIRSVLRAGKVDNAGRMLGKPFAVEGTVVPGAGRGHDLGFPTANLKVWEEQLLPAPGVYAVRAKMSEQTWPAIVNIGVRPTFDRDFPLTIEAHLLDFDGDLYGKQLELHFEYWLRGEQHFASVDDLCRQIRLDEQQARKRLKREGRYVR